MKNYDYVYFKNIVDKVNTGADAIKRAPIVDENTGIKCIRIQDISQNKDFCNWGFTKIRDSDYYKFELKKDYILIARTGETIGENCVISKDLRAVYNNGLIRVIVNRNKCFPLYLHYILQSAMFYGFVDNYFRSTSTQPNMKIGDLLKFQFLLPPLPIQRKIAAVLSAYDDLIENNNRRIAVLEKMAEEIYREWFVRLRFPGHENVKIVKGVPEGWEVRKIGSVVKPQYGYTESAVLNESLPKYLRVMDINKHSYVKWADVPNCPINEADFQKYKLNIFDVVIARMADPGKLAIIEQNIPAVFASYLIKLIPDLKFITPYFLFYTLANDYYQGLFSNADTAATRGSINGQVIASFQIILPPVAVQKRFDEIIFQFRKSLNTYLQQNQSLRCTRDMLLSRLLSGKLSVENLDIRFPKSMEEADA